MAIDQRDGGGEERPGHPMGASIILVTLVVLLILALAIGGTVR
jgi:hypothetical protein